MSIIGLALLVVGIISHVPLLILLGIFFLVLELLDN